MTRANTLPFTRNVQKYQISVWFQTICFKHFKMASKDRKGMSTTNDRKWNVRYVLVDTPIKQGMIWIGNYI